MKTTQTQQISPIRVVGIAAWIDKDQAPQQIGALWGQAAQSGLLQPGQAGYGVYFDYADQLASRYRVLVGAESEAAPGPGQEVVLIPEGSYAAFHGEGAAAEVVPGIWAHIWQSWPESDTRTFQVDFERYVGSPDNSKIEVMIGVK